MSSSSSFTRTPPYPNHPSSPLLRRHRLHHLPFTISQSRSPYRPGLLNTARFFRRAGSRRVLCEPSMIVSKAAAEQLEGRQTDWAYSRPVVVLDVIWNFAFITAAIAVFIMSMDERPSMPLRVWIAGYALQCLSHAICVPSLAISSGFLDADMTGNIMCIEGMSI